MLGVGTLWERPAFWSVLFTFLYLLFEIVYVYVCVCSIQGGQKRASDSHGTGVTGSCEPPAVGTGK